MLKEAECRAPTATEAIMIEGGFQIALQSTDSMHTPLRVFVIEDSPILLERIAEAIADQPSLVLVGTADCEHEAVQMIRSLKPEALVVDIKLREGNGLNVLARLKWGEGNDAKPKIVVFTNYPRQEYLRNSKQLGADYFLDKSTQFLDLPKILIGLRVTSSRTQ